MSIIISNISPEYSRQGMQRYQVSLNRIPLVEFNHSAEDGMAVCLRKAYEALLEVSIDEKIAEYHKKQFYSLLESTQHLKPY
jgi:hypothetical protein